MALNASIELKRFEEHQCILLSVLALFCVKLPVVAKDKNSKP
jgi:hypothetical protein